MFAFISSVLSILFRPKSFFESISECHPFSEAIAFYFKLFMSLVLISAGVLIAVTGIWRASSGALVGYTSILGLAVLFIFTVVVATMFVTAALMHIFVLIFGGKGGLSGTFSVFAYGNAAQVLVLPVAIFTGLLTKEVPSASLLLMPGPLAYISIVLIWTFTIHVIGYKEVHGMGILRSAAALLAPPVLFILLSMLFLSTFFGGMAQNLKNIGSRITLTSKAATWEPASPIQWRGDLAAAIDDAGQSDSVVMIYFYSEWCDWCKKLNSETYGDKDVAELAKRFICVKIDAEQNMNTVQHYGVWAYPTIIFMDHKGTELKRVSGYIDSRGLAKIMKQVAPKDIVVAPEPAKSDESGSTNSGEKAAGSRFTLKGIVATRTGYSALVNEYRVQTGDTIGDVKVVEVSKEYVRLLDEDGKEIVLRLEP